MIAGKKRCVSEGKGERFIYMAQPWSLREMVDVKEEGDNETIRSFEPQSVNSHAVDVLSSNICFVAGDQTLFR